MHVGTQQFTISDEDLEHLARHGVFNKNENFITFHREYGWDVEELVAKKEKCARFGIDMEMVALPMAQFNVNGDSVPNFMTGNYREGDKEIKLVINMVRQAAAAGISAIKYYLCALENQRTESTPPGRGGSIYSTEPMNTAHPLRDIERIDGPPGPYLEAIGTVFATFGAPIQDSGNVSYGVQVGDERFFVKTTNPRAEVFCDHATRGALLYNAARLRHSCDHPTLPVLHRIVETAHGPALVYDWVDGECLHGGRDNPQSAHQRFRRLPTDAILAVLDAIYDLHLQLVQRGWIAVDFYDGCLMYDFERQAAHVVDLDNYHLGAFTNQMGRMFGSTRFMAPEEFERGALIDERTTVFTMGRTAAVCLGDDIGGAMGAVVRRACRQERAERYPSMAEFYADWQQARRIACCTL